MKFDLRKARLNRGCSLRTMADEIGVPRAVLSRAERGEGKPHPEHQLAIAEFHELLPTDIWPLDEAKTTV